MPQNFVHNYFIQDQDHVYVMKQLGSSG